MNYEKSIIQINAAEANYFRLCELAETDDAIGKALELLHRLKAEHKAHFHTLTRIDGKWI